LLVSKIKSTQPVPIRLSWPVMMFSVTPFSVSLRPNSAASNKISTDSSNEARSMGPAETRLMPWRLMAINVPRNVMQSASTM
jgi:hypothetical protein